jgi:hypothetical protein
MKTGIELIAKERQEQIEKNGFTPNSDTEYKNGELVKAAQFCLNPKTSNSDWPDGWNTYFKYKILEDSRIEQLEKAGAFYMAENQRLGNLKYQPEIDKIANEIDRLSYKK